MSAPAIKQLLRNLGSSASHEAWEVFLRDYATLIFQVIHYIETDADKAGDCFQFVCEHLVENRFRRLRKFKVDGAASFPTWLRAVVRNLCLDWRRKQLGRPRLFRSIARLSLFDQEVFRAVYERAHSPEETLVMLAAQFPQVTAEQVAESRVRIEKELSGRQRWLLALHSNQAGGGNSTEEVDESAFRNLIDSRPDPEAQFISREAQAKLRLVLGRLSQSDRLLLRLRFEQELTLDQCARLLDLGNAQRVDRQIKELILRLREVMSE